MGAGSIIEGPPATATLHNRPYPAGAVSRVLLYNTRLPSGVQPRAPAAAGNHVSCRGMPPSADTTYTCGDPLRSEVNAIHFPSGEKCGSLSTAGVLVIRTASPPCLPTTQISPPYSKASWVALRLGCRRSRVPCASMALIRNRNNNAMGKIREYHIDELIVSKYKNFRQTRERRISRSAKKA